ncbi:hypothetical protein B9Z55_027518 [Caenorhabditis nigoni]|uniref:Uncharacterized protein n=1 Tax=Caenorhabditis nigoni TaxID=1611254 RepID=A0A2G5SGF2_9PELO|nr:hypothetical protein B9Z55_027518 [Caenorhabditis nigoni]
MKKRIKSSQMNRSKMIDYIEYDCDQDEEPFVYVVYKHVGRAERMIDIQISDEYRNPVVRFHMEEREAVISSMHNYFLGFFGNSVECLWKAKGYKISIPQLQNLRGCIKFSSYGANMETLANFFSSSPVSNGLIIRLMGQQNHSIRNQTFTGQNRFKPFN